MFSGSLDQMSGQTSDEQYNESQPRGTNEEGYLPSVPNVPLNTRAFIINEFMWVDITRLGEFCGIFQSNLQNEALPRQYHLE